MDIIYRNIEEWSPDMECKNLIVFDDNITDIFMHKKFSPLVTELFPLLLLYNLLLPYKK